MSLTGHAYFDVAESTLPGEPPTASWIPPISLEKAYLWEPRPNGIDEKAARNILGASGCIWSDQFLHNAAILADKPGQGTSASEAYVDYLSLPRMAALAEVVWTPQASRDYDDFRHRMRTQYLRYQHAGYHFRMPTPDVEVKRLSDGSLQATGESPIEGGTVRYTLDGSEPGPASATLTGHLTTRNDAIFKAVTYAADGSHSLTWTHMEAANNFAHLGRVIGGWKAGQIGNAKPKEVTFDATGFIDSNGSYLITFQYTGGSQRLNIDGITQQEIDANTCGPAHQPWYRMGNLCGIDGHLPKPWHADQVALQHKILKRMRELVIEPVIQSLAGFVPRAFSRIHPETQLHDTCWNGSLPSPNQPVMMLPDDPQFSNLTKLYMNGWKKEFGQAKYFLVDSFNEMEVPKTALPMTELLADNGEKTWQSIRAADPDAIWVIQGWTFGYQHWQPENLSALFSKVPDDRMLVLDYANDYGNCWGKYNDKSSAFYGKSWAFGDVPNMEGKTACTGNLNL